jgi:hypothetical protein
MTIDANIPMMYQGIQLNDPLETAGRAMSLRNMAAQNDMYQAQADSQQRQNSLGKMRQQAFAQAGGDPVKFRATLANMGDMEGVNALDEQSTKSQKAEADLASTKAGTQEKMSKLRSQAAIIGYTGGTMQHAQMAADALRQGGDTVGADHIDQLIQAHPDATPDQIRQVFKPYIASQQTPDSLLVPKMMAAGGSLVDTNPNTGAAPIPMTQSPDSIASNQIARQGQAITMRGQDLTNSRALEANANAKLAAPKLTEIQAKSQLYGTRAKASHDILNNLEGKYSPMAVNAKMAASDTPGIGGLAGAIGNFMLSENGQKAEQAQRDFINAILRQESGAVISESEFKNAQKQYFPQPGDTKGVLQQKRENRARAIKGLDVMSGPAGGFSNQAPTNGGAKFLGFE